MDGAESFVRPFARAEKTDSSLATRLVPQEGQAISSPSRRTSFSNLLPQSWHVYSKIGINLLNQR
jgi:hypothetical protein